MFPFDDVIMGATVFDEISSAILQDSFWPTKRYCHWWPKMQHFAISATPDNYVDSLIDKYTYESILSYVHIYSWMK